MWTRITSYFVLLLTSNLAIGQTNYEREVKQFLSDILADSYTYNLKNYIDDSSKLSKTDPLDFEYSFLKNHIDTSMSKYMLRTDNGKMHFDTLLVVKEPDDFYYDNESKQLLKFFTGTQFLTFLIHLTSRQKISASRLICRIRTRSLTDLFQRSL